MSRCIQRRLWGLALLLAAVNSSAQLVFEEPELTARPDASMREVSQAFVFVNAGDYPLTVVSVRGPKDCRVARLQKRTYRPGERGQIEVTFPLGRSGGLQSRFITVRTDQREDPTQELILNVDAPQLLKVSSSRLRWEPDAEAAPQTVTVEAMEGLELKALTARVMGRAQALKVEVAEQEPGRKYVLTVTPAATDKPLMAPIMLEAELADGRSVRAGVVALVGVKRPAKRDVPAPAEGAEEQAQEKATP